jgi:hypothetical protein
MKLSKNYVENVYLMEEFTAEQATVDRFDITRALQNNFFGNSYGGNPAFNFYRKESTKLLLTFQLNRVGFTELVELLVKLRVETMLMYPTLFRVDTKGWYDLRRMKEKDEKDKWLATPVDSKFTKLAKKENRVSFVVHK